MIDDRHIPSDVTAAEWEAAFAKSPETIARELVIESVDSGFHVIATDGAKESLVHTIAAAIRDAERRGAEQGAASMRERAARDCERDHIKPAFEAGWDAVHTYGQPLLESNLLHTLYMRGYKQALIDAAGGIRALEIGEGE